jgi:hypothetical protein
MESDGRWPLFIDGHQAACAALARVEHYFEEAGRRALTNSRSARMKRSNMAGISRSTVMAPKLLAYASA